MELPQQVALTKFQGAGGDIEVSTVRLIVDHSWGYGKPLWYETMVFGGFMDEMCERCETAEQALVQHDKILARAKSYEKEKED